MKKFLLTCLCLITASCGLRDSTEELFAQIENLIAEYRAAGRSIELSRIDSVKWDELIIIRPYTALELLPEILAKDITVQQSGIEFRDDITLLAFMDKGHVVKVVVFPRSLFDFSALGRDHFTPQDSVPLP